MFRAAREYAWGQGILPPHLEGPFLAPECIGAHNPELRRDPTVEFAAKLMEWSGGFIGWITMAAERPGADEVIRYLSGNGVSVSLGTRTRRSNTSWPRFRRARPASPTC